MENKKHYYNITHAAKLIGVSRMTLHDWRKKKWIAFAKDYRNYNVITQKELDRIIDWRSKTK